MTLTMLKAQCMNGERTKKIITVYWYYIHKQKCWIILVWPTWMRLFREIKKRLISRDAVLIFECDCINLLGYFSCCFPCSRHLLLNVWQVSVYSSFCSNYLHMCNWQDCLQFLYVVEKKYLITSIHEELAQIIWYV